MLSLLCVALNDTCVTIIYYYAVEGED